MPNPQVYLVVSTNPDISKSYAIVHGVFYDKVLAQRHRDMFWHNYNLLCEIKTFNVTLDI